MCNGFYNRQGASERELIRNTFTANLRREGAGYVFNEPIQVPDIFFSVKFEYLPQLSSRLTANQDPQYYLSRHTTG